MINRSHAAIRGELGRVVVRGSVPSRELAQSRWQSFRVGSVPAQWEGGFRTSDQGSGDSAISRGRMTAVHTAYPASFR